MFSDRLYQKYQNLLQDDVRLINRIQGSAERMQALIIDILAFSRISIDKTNFVLSNMNEILQEILTDINEEIHTRNASITIDDLPTLEVNPRLMRMLFHNLISNALKYSKTDVPPKIDISSNVVTENNRQYNLIVVKDNGIGFEQEYADKIFQIFTRLHGNADYSGTGVGLSIVKKVVENHNGFIGVESSPGHGATFNIYLPVEQ